MWLGTKLFSGMYCEVRVEISVRPRVPVAAKTFTLVYT